MGLSIGMNKKIRTSQIKLFPGSKYLYGLFTSVGYL